MTRYRTIVADPPWAYATSMAVTGNAPGRTRQHGRSETPYSTMTVAHIAALTIPAADDAHLYLWTTNTHAEHSWRIARDWGFVPKNLLTWCKPPKGMIGFGTFSQSSEFVLFATRGATIGGRCERTWFEWSRSTHSQKPEAFLDLVEALSPGPYLEMFARRGRFGWDYWGDESLGTAELGGVAS